MPTDDASAHASLCSALASLLEGPARKEMVEDLTRTASLDAALARLRTSMSKHRLGGLPDEFAGLVHRLDRRTREDGFRVLHSWDHTAHRFTDDIVPVLMVDYFERAEPHEPDLPTTLSILLDYYLLHLLALAAMRVWDTEDPGRALDRVTELLQLLQGPGGSGHHFVGDAETLLIYALSQFHPEEQAYDRVIARMDTLPHRNRVGFAQVSAAVLGAHLRWGFWLMYERDIQRMRDDNVGDYPWLLWSVTTLLRAWSELRDDQAHDAHRRALAGSLLLGLSADPWALIERTPSALAPFSELYSECRGILEAHGDELLADLEALRPPKDAWAPLSLLFNFPHNALVASATIALVEGRPCPVPLDDLLRGSATDADAAAAREALARDLTEFSRARPERLGYRGALLVAYDPLTALRSWSSTMKVLRRATESDACG